jgi:hypothetical protein
MRQELPTALLCADCFGHRGVNPGLYLGVRQRSILELTPGSISEDMNMLLGNPMKGNLPISGTSSEQTLIVGGR